jgi:hypothetical protein
MKGFIKHFAVASSFAASLFMLIGCYHYRELVDPCWPERYNSTARASVREMCTAQSNKGHILDQTIWNSYFERDLKTGDGTAKLNEAGQEVLRYIARRQPFPDFHLWLQYPHDVKDVGKREQVVADRKVAIQNFLSTQTLLGGGDNYQISMHDFVQPTYPAEWAEKAYRAIDMQGKLIAVPQGSGGSGGGGGAIR